MAQYRPLRITEDAVNTIVIRNSILLLSLLFFPRYAFSKEKDVVRSVVAFDSSAQVARGGEVEIMLNAVPNYGNPIIFDIQKKPSHGTLTQPQNQSDHTALVIYHHDGSKWVLKDEFTFRVASIGRAKSIAYKVSLQIIPPPAHIVFKPSVISFGSVLISEQSQTNLLISNMGGTKASCRLLLPKGFTAPDGDIFTLDEGESMKLPICFSPTDEGDFSAEVSLIPTLDKNSLFLKGKGIPRYAVSKKNDVEWAIKNLSTSPVTISFAGGQGWILPSATLVPSHAEQLISFHQIEQTNVETSVLDKDTHVSITDGMSTNEIELPQPQRFIPLMVQRVAPESLGTFLIGSPLTVSFQLQNRSAFPKQVKWIATSPSGGGMSEQKSMELKGGELKEFSFAWIPTLPGPATLKLQFLDGASATNELSWKASLFAGSMGQGAPNAAPVVMTPEIKLEEVASPTPKPTPAIQIPQLEEVASGVETSFFGDITPFIEWKSLGDDPSQVSLVELCMVRSPVVPNQNAGSTPSFQFQSIPITITQQTKKDDRERILTAPLSAGYHLLKLTLFKNGSMENSSQIAVRIPNRVSWWDRYKTPFGILILILLFLILRKVRQLS